MATRGKEHAAYSGTQFESWWIYYLKIWRLEGSGPPILGTEGK